jgi:hypothetical protein
MQDEIPHTDICEQCEREIVSNVEQVEGKHKIIHHARTADEGFTPITAGKATIRFHCSCSSMTVEFGPGSTSAWDVPDEWLWKGDDNDKTGPTQR